jgi:hypothetical protein
MGKKTEDALAGREKHNAETEVWHREPSSGHLTFGKACLGDATTVDEVAEVLRKYPQYAGAILEAVNQTLGNKIAIAAAEAAQIADHSATVSNRAAMGDPTKKTEVKDKTAVGPSTALPFTTSGWDSAAIASQLGQYDRITGTDNDAERCSFANLLIAKVFAGPETTSKYLLGVKKRVEGGSIELIPGRRDAMAAAALTLEAVSKAIDARTATFGDLSWAQEALYETFVDQIGGGTVSRGVTNLVGEDQGFFHIGNEVKGSAVPHDPTTGNGCVESVKELSDWGRGLVEGQFYVCVWIGPANNPSEVSHQIMLVKHGGEPNIYDPEIHGDGDHLFPLTSPKIPLYFKGGKRIAMTLLSDAPPAKKADKKDKKDKNDKAPKP